MSDSINLARLKSVYRDWNASKGESVDKWMDLLADKVGIRSIQEDAAGLRFARDRHSKSEALDYFTGILQEWEMIHWTPDEFLEDGDRIAVFGRCAWTNRKTGKSAEVLIANLWKFENGKAVEVTEVFDTARAVAAASQD